MKHKNMSWMRLAAAAVVGAGVVVGGLSVADAAPNGAEANQAAYWEAQGYGDCDKVLDTETKSYTVPAGTWSALILKAGSARSTATPNQVIISPEASATYTHDSGKGISHVILCSGGGGTGSFS